MARNALVEDNWTLKAAEDLSVCDSFDCGHDDINEYFRVDVKWHKEELLTQTYCLYESSAPMLVLALLDFCNDTVQLKKLPPGIDPRIRYPFLPAVKLTRFGVAKQFQRKSVGTHALNMAKKFFTTDNRTGCRFMTVDARNDTGVINFYERNRFNLFNDKDKSSDSRSLFFDLKRLEV